MDGLYVLNNPWAVQSMEKQTSYCAMMQLGMPIPETWMHPAEVLRGAAGPAPTLRTYAKLFDLGEVGRSARLPDVHEAVRRRWMARRQPDRRRGGAPKPATSESGKLVMHLQNAVRPVRLFRELHWLGPQTHLVRYDPSAPLHDRYTMNKGFVPDASRAAPRYDSHHQRVLRLGLQLLRGAAQRWSLVPDRLRQPVPRLAGHVAALPLPLARHGQSALVDLLCGDQATRCARPRLGALLRDRAPRRPVPREAPALCRRSRSSASRLRVSTSFARSTSATSTRSPARVLRFAGAKEAVRQKVDALFPGARGRGVHGALLESHPGVAGGREGTPMKTTSRWESRSGWIATSPWCAGGHFGQPVLLFPTAGGDAEEIERFHIDRGARSR